MVMPGDNIKMVVTLITRSRWTMVGVLQSVKVAVPLARALLLKFWANYTLIRSELKRALRRLFAARNLSSKYLVVILLAELWRK